MIAVDVFTRFVRAEPARAASAEEAVKIFSTWSKPQMLDTDGGPEWKGDLHAMLERNGVAHRLKAPADTNALAVVDRFSRSRLQSLDAGWRRANRIGRFSCQTWWRR